MNGGGETQFSPQHCPVVGPTYTLTPCDPAAWPSCLSMVLASNGLMHFSSVFICSLTQAVGGYLLSTIQVPGTILGDQDKQGQLTSTGRRVPTWVECHGGRELGREWRIMGQGGQFSGGRSWRRFFQGRDVSAEARRMHESPLCKNIQRTFQAKATASLQTLSPKRAHHILGWSVPGARRRPVLSRKSMTYPRGAQSLRDGMRWEELVRTRS